MFLVALRHGRTGWNAVGRFQGHADPPLDEEGLVQAEQAAADLGSLVRQGLLGPGNPAVLSSDLRRSADTAHLVGEAVGSAVTLDPDLREVDLGGWAGLDHDEAKARFPVEYRRWEAGEEVRRGGGETPAEVGRRVAACVRGALIAAPERSLIVVSHGVALRAGLEALRASGVVDFSGPAPHLANGQHLTVSVSNPERSRPCEAPTFL